MRQMIWDNIAARFAAMRPEAGQGLAEYALILGLVGLVAAGALTVLGAGVSNVLTEIANKL
jgi:Flp pilus assembly pilin Flp